MEDLCTYKELAHDALADYFYEGSCAYDNLMHSRFSVPTVTLEAKKAVAAGINTEYGALCTVQEIFEEFCGYGIAVADLAEENGLSFEEYCEAYCEECLRRTFG